MDVIIIKVGIRLPGNLAYCPIWSVGLQTGNFIETV